MRFLKRGKSDKKDNGVTSGNRRPSLFGGSIRRRKVGDKKTDGRFAKKFKSGPLETPEGVKDTSITALQSQRFKSERTLGPIVEEVSTDVSSEEGTDKDTDLIFETLEEKPTVLAREKAINNYFCGCFDFNFGDS